MGKGQEAAYPGGTFTAELPGQRQPHVLSLLPLPGAPASASSFRPRPSSSEALNLNQEPVTPSSPTAPVQVLVTHLYSHPQLYGQGLVTVLYSHGDS